jgi:hypothetical protein
VVSAFRTVIHFWKRGIWHGLPCRADSPGAAWKLEQSPPKRSLNAAPLLKCGCEVEIPGVFIRQHPGTPPRAPGESLGIAVLRGGTSKAAPPSLETLEQFRTKNCEGYLLLLSCYEIRTAGQLDSKSSAVRRRSRCGFVRGSPVLSSHFSRGFAPQVGQGTV